MKNIYDFENREAPYISEALLSDELDRRRSRRAATIAFFSGILAEILFVICGFILLDTIALLSALLFTYAAAGIGGLALVLISFTRKRRTKENGYN